jgi:hypothetical protein
MEKGGFQGEMMENEPLDALPLKKASHLLLPSTFKAEEMNTVQKTNVCLDGNICEKFISNATSSNVLFYESGSISHLSPSRSPDGRQNDMEDYFQTPKAPIRKRNHIQSLYHAILSSSLDQVKCCLKEGGDPNAKIFFNATKGQVFVGYTPPIFVAALLGYKEILQLLLDEGGCVNAVNFENQNSLHFLFNRSPYSHSLPSTAHSLSYQSVQKSYAEFDDYLKVNQESLPDAYENIKSTGSDLSAVNDSPSFTKCLALPNLQTQQDKTFECVHILLKYGINIHAKDSKGWLPLDYAIQIYGLTESHPVVKLLSE